MHADLKRSSFVPLLCLLTAAAAAQPTATINYSVSMPQPASHLFHVTLHAGGLHGEFHDFKMPAWAPGYYRLLDFEKYVQNFSASDANGRPLPFEKAGKNTWRIVTGGGASLVLNYDVFGAVSFAVQNFLNENRALLSPPGLFLYEDGKLSQPVTIDIQAPPGWKTVATGLDVVPGKPGVFSAANFDVLYDSPVSLGNQEMLRFEVRGVPHDISLENVAASADRKRMTADLQRVVGAATRLMGDIPYAHYAFLMVGAGNGGVEHLNSASIAFNGNSLGTEEGYLRWLSYVAHEYFHNFNVKRIRPIALGPFDYEAENLTNMLWVSEGLSVYYQDLLLVRAGLMTREQYLDKMAAAIGRFENAPGRRFQSATESSWTTWGTSGVGNDRNTTISYYDNGAMLGAMLDLAIRSQSRNRKSLDDVMRGLYRTYYKTKQRGFTDAEFRTECEEAAGGPLDEVFDYAATTKAVNYAKYFAMAGLETKVTSEEAPGVYLGANFQVRGMKLAVTSVDPGSPAEAAGMRVNDELAETVKLLSDALNASKPGDALKLRGAREIEVTLGKNSKRTWTIRPSGQGRELENAIRNDWLRSQQ
jgi:predicted metalloprotease with PDZ domain